MIIDLIASHPEEMAQLAPRLRSRRHWQSLLAPTAERAPYMLEAMRAMPIFTTHAPRRSGRRAWARALAQDPSMQSTPEHPARLCHFIGWLHRLADRRLPAAPQLRRWRDLYGPNEEVQRIRPVAHDRYIPNPHRGTTTFQRFQGDPIYTTMAWSDTDGPLRFPKGGGKIRDNAGYIPRTTLSYCRWPWKWLEPRKGAYAWSIIDGALRTAAARGQTLQLRFQPFTARWNVEEHPLGRHRTPPGPTTVNVPDWYWDTGAAWIGRGPYSPNEPDHNDPLYAQHFGDFIRAFAARYDGHPALESVDVSVAGMWGESGGNATPETLCALTSIYTRHFTRTQLVGMLGSAGLTHARASGCNIGWRADCFGDLRKSWVADMPRNAAWSNTWDSYDRSIRNCGVTDAWKTAPVTMETCGDVTTWAMDGYELDQIIELGYSYHMSVFMPKSTAMPERWLAKLAEFDRRIGYRFVLRQMKLPLSATRGQRFLVETVVGNVGCAPIYRPYRLALRLKQGRTVRVLRFAADLRGWLPGNAYFDEHLVLPAEFQPGEVQIALGVVGEDDQPRVWFAINGRLDDGWHPLTSIDAV